MRRLPNQAYPGSAASFLSRLFLGNMASNSSTNRAAPEVWAERYRRRKFPNCDEEIPPLEIKRSYEGENPSLEGRMLQEAALILGVSKGETPDFKMELVEKSDYYTGECD